MHPLIFFQDAFRENLSYIKWMSPASADAARAKLEHMADLIGFPNFVLNSTWLDQGNYIWHYMCYHKLDTEQCWSLRLEVWGSFEKKIQEMISLAICIFLAIKYQKLNVFHLSILNPQFWIFCNLFIWLSLWWAWVTPLII